MIRYVNTPDRGKLNLRVTHDKNSGVLAKIPNNTKLEVEYVNDEWCNTEYNGIRGCVMSKFLSKEGAVTTEDLKEIYNSLKATLDTIEKILTR